MPVYKDESTNTWYAQFYYKDWDGKRKHTTKRGFAKKSEAAKFEAAFKYSKKNKKITVSGLIDLYKLNLQQRLQLKTVKPSTIQNYENIIDNYILPYFDADKPLDSITGDTINAWLVYLSNRLSTSTDQKLALGTIKMVKSFLGVLLNFAVRKKYLSASPMIEAEKLPTPKQKQLKVWGKEEYAIFYDSLKQEHHRIIFNLMFFGGLRIGEVLALTPADVYPDGTLYIKNTLALVNKKYVIQDAKTPYSVRKISLPTSIYQQLLDYISKLYKWDPHERIFPFTESGIEYFIKRRIKLLGLPKLTPHGLRHSNASILLRYTADIAMVSRRLGHKNPKVTLEVYSHMMPGSEENGIQVLNDIALGREPEKFIVAKISENSLEK